MAREIEIRAAEKAREAIPRKLESKWDKDPFTYAPGSVQQSRDG